MGHQGFKYQLGNLIYRFGCQAFKTALSLSALSQPTQRFHNFMIFSRKNLVGIMSLVHMQMLKWTGILESSPLESTFSSTSDLLM